MMQGIDVSHYNGDVDWKKVKSSGKAFAFVRIGWSGYAGEIHLDKCFHQNMVGAAAAGLKVGIYVYAYNKDPASAQKTAAEIVRILKDNSYSVTFPIAFDVEETADSCLVAQGKTGLASTCMAFFETIKAAGFAPILYSYTSFLTNYLNMAMLKHYDCWVADYREQTGTTCPYLGKHTIWQYKGETGRCSGVSGACDLNVAYTDYGGSVEIDYKALYLEIKQELEGVLKRC